MEVLGMDLASGSGAYVVRFLMNEFTNVDVL